MHSPRSLFFNDADSGLQAILVLDSLVLGPAAGGIRTREYASLSEALADAQKLARAMTIKNALAGLDAGGGKAVVLLHSQMDRAKAFAKLGEHIEALGGLFHTAGDFGTTADDLAAVASTTSHVETDEKSLAAAVAVGVLAALHACAAQKGRADLAGLRILVQGCGAIGSAVAGQLAQAGAELLLTDIDGQRAQILAQQTGARIVTADAWLGEKIDIFCPCALGGVVDRSVARQLSAWAVCGAANNVISSEAAEQILGERGLLFVPDVVASAGAVIEGVGKRIMGLQDCRPLLARIGETAARILQRADRSKKLPSTIAQELAFERIEQAESQRQTDDPAHNAK